MCPRVSSCLTTIYSLCKWKTEGFFSSRDKTFSELHVCYSNGRTVKVLVPVAKTSGNVKEARYGLFGSKRGFFCYLPVKIHSLLNLLGGNWRPWVYITFGLVSPVAAAIPTVFFVPQWHKWESVLQLINLPTPVYWWNPKLEMFSLQNRNVAYKPDQDFSCLGK